MKILFSLRNFWYVKFFESAVRQLAERGHDVRLLADERDADSSHGAWEAMAARLAAGSSRISYGYAAHADVDDWTGFASTLRFGLDYLRFKEPQYDSAPKLRARAGERAPAGVVRLSDSFFWRTRPGRGLLRGALAFCERAIPDNAAAVQVLEAEKPDVLLVSPLISLGSPQFDLLRAARRLGHRTVLAVGSWDHLSSKALIRDVPDRVLVWNDTQKQEAVRLHNVPADRVVVTGAQCFDQWFERQPRWTPDAFRRRVGLPEGQPFVLYVCSCLFDGSPNEAAFVRTWVSAVRAHPALRDLAILVRPHPKRGHEWASVRLDDMPTVALWPADAQAPFDRDSKDDYFDSLYHSEAVVGLNTSALIEAGVVGRPVHTMLLPEFRDNQEGTLHFRYLLDVGGGLLAASPTLDAHVESLASSIANPAGARLRSEMFVRAFVRPAGPRVPSTPNFVEAVERLAASPAPPPVGAAFWRRPLQAALHPLAAATRGSESVERRKRMREEARLRAADLQRRESEKQRRLSQEVEERNRRVERERAEREARRSAKVKAKEDAVAAKRRQKQQALREKTRQRTLQRLRGRLATLLGRRVGNR